MGTLRLIGDVHGTYSRYLELLKDTDYSVQLGDFGFDYSILKNLDSTKHRILPGNHDNYDDMNHPHFLGDFGTYQVGNFDCFFIRGGYSIDKALRIPKISWWAEEELTYVQMIECVGQYKIAKPDIVISHECPAQITPLFLKHIYSGYSRHFKPSATAQLLQYLLEVHPPSMWICAHLHLSYNEVIDKTRFIVLDELETFDLEI